MINSLTREQYCQLQLSLSENVGPITFRDLMRYYKTAEEALKQLPEIAARGGRRRPIKVADTKIVDTQIIAANKNEALILTPDSNEYPRLLREIEDCPPVLFAKGEASLMSKPGVGIVGSRNCSQNGQNMARQFGFELVENGYVASSGMARGIDTAAHEGALTSFNTKGGTVAVLGTGVDVVYPAENEKLYQQIADRGCVVSEFPMGTKPSVCNFPRRNRVISGLSIGVLVIEAGEMSGSLITARTAISQDREVFAIPGSPADSRNKGSNQLIKDGAHLVTTPEDVLEIIERDTTKLLLDIEQGNSSVYDKPLSFIDEAELAKARSIILCRLTPEVTGVNQLIRGTGLPIGLVSIILVELELAGKIERFAGNKISLVYENEWGN